MDINRDESQPFDRFKDPDAMDTSLDLSRKDERNDKVDDQTSGVEISANQDAEAILERPREEESRSAVVDQDGKTFGRLLVAVAVRLELT